MDDAFWARILDVKAAVNGALEKARNDKLIGAGLSAQVTLYAKPEIKALLNKVADELHFILITSAANLADFDAAQGVETELSELRVAVAASSYENANVAGTKMPASANGKTPYFVSALHR